MAKRWYSVSVLSNFEKKVAEAIRQAVAEKAGRLFPLSLASEGSAQIGGVLATNAGGTAVLAYGNARNLCLGLEVVLADGRIWHGLRALKKDKSDKAVARKQEIESEIETSKAKAKKAGAVGAAPKKAKAKAKAKPAD